MEELPCEDNEDNIPVALPEAVVIESGVLELLLPKFGSSDQSFEGAGSKAGGGGGVYAWTGGGGAGGGAEGVALKN